MFVIRRNFKHVLLKSLHIQVSVYSDRNTMSLDQKQIAYLSILALLFLNTPIRCFPLIPSFQHNEGPVPYVCVGCFIEEEPDIRIVEAYMMAGTCVSPSLQRGRKRGKEGDRNRDRQTQRPLQFCSINSCFLEREDQGLQIVITFRR